MAGRTRRTAGKSSGKSAGRSAAKRSSNAPEPRLRPGVRAALWCAAAGVALFALLLTASLLTFSPYRHLGMPKIEERHYRTLNRLSSDLSRKIFRPDPPVEVRLHLAPDEVNELLELARHASGFGKDMPPPWSFNLVYLRDGRFAFVMPIDAAPEWLFGGKIYTRGSFHLEKLDDKLVLDVPELRFGRADVPIPGGGLYAGSSGVEALKKSLPPEFGAAIRSFYPESDGSLVLICRPAGVMALLMRLASGAA